MNNYIAAFFHGRLRVRSLLFSSPERAAFSDKSVFFRTLVAMFILCMAAESHSAVITYDESIDGDLLDLSLVGDGIFSATDATNIGTLGIGTNTVSGVTSWDRVNPVDFDGFVFSVVPGTQLITSQIYFSFTGALIGAGYTLMENVGPDLYGFVENPYPVNNISILSPDLSSPYNVFSDFADVSLPLMSGNYAFYPTYVIAEVPGGTMSYTWELQVTAVPLPPSLYLFGSGFAAIFGFNRRKSR